MKEEKIVKILTYFYWIPFGIVILLNTFNSLFRTTCFDMGLYVEAANYKWDISIVVLAMAAIIFLFFHFMLNKKICVEKIRQGILIWAGMVSLVSVLLFRCVAKCDSGFLNEVAIQFLQNNYQAFEAGEYLYMYPFQLGFTAVMELVYQMFGVENFIVFELVNIICIIDVICVICKITEELFEDEKISKIVAMLSGGMLPLFLLATFIYGDIPGWCMAVNVIFHIIRYLKSDKWAEILKASVWLSVGIVMKSNLNIMLVAAVIVIILHALKKKNLKSVLNVLIIIVVSQLGMMAVNGVYSVRTGKEIPDGIPKIAWVAMGMQEPYEDGSPAGWYNGYNWNIYVQNEFDSESTKAACVADIKQSLQHFVKHPKEALSFLYEKFTAQWNEPSFMSLLTNEWYSRNVAPQSRIAEFFLYGMGRTILLFLMNVYHFVISVGTAVFCVSSFSKWSLPKAYLVLNIFGGLLFHMVWEAKSRYVLIYFILMLPLAAWGLWNIDRKLFGKK